MKKVSAFLDAVAAGDPQTAEALLPLVYPELRRIASQLMAGERRPHTLQTTALINEAWLRIAAGRDTQWQSPAHFLFTAIRAMRHVLIDRAKSKRAVKHGGGLVRVPADAIDIAAESPDAHLLAVAEAIERLAGPRPRQAALLDLKYFGDMTIEDAGAVLGISPATAYRDWKAAHDWIERKHTTE